MCADAAAMQWSADFRDRKAKPTNTEPGVIYMLAGATQRSDTDPYDTTSQPIPIGPHWMIMWPFDPKATGLPTTHKATGAYIMWAGSPYPTSTLWDVPDGEGCNDSTHCDRHSRSGFSQARVRNLPIRPDAVPRALAHPASLMRGTIPHGR